MAGHRLYEESDVARLYQVLALRQLGLGLDTVGEVMAGSTSMTELLAAHHEYLGEQLTVIRELRAQVATLAAKMKQRSTATVEDFLELIPKVMMVDDTVKKCFSNDQLADLAERRERLGEGAIADVQAG